MTVLFEHHLESQGLRQNEEAMSNGSHEMVAHEDNTAAQSNPHTPSSFHKRTPSSLNKSNLDQLNSDNKPTNVVLTNPNNTQSITSFNIANDDPYRSTDSETNDFLDDAEEDHTGQQSTPINSNQTDSSLPNFRP